MPKTCCIIDCQNSNSDSNQRNLFMIPKAEEQRQKWIDAISPHLREGRKNRKVLYVCDLHFKDEDILRYTYIHLKDGSIDKIARIRIVLKPSSIPCIFNEKKTIFIKIELPAAENNISKALIPGVNGQIELALEEKRGIEWTNSEGETKPRLIADGKKAFNLEMLAKELKILWEKAENPVWRSCMTPSGLLLSFFSQYPKVATKTILVKENMSTEIRAAGHIVMNNFQEKIKSVDVLLSVMSEVQKKHLCQGIDDNTSCPYNYFEPLTPCSSARCISCRIERKKILNNLSREKKRSELTAHKTKLVMKNLRRRNQRLEKNLASAKEDIKVLRVRCAAFAAGI